MYGWLNNCIKRLFFVTTVKNGSASTETSLSAAHADPDQSSQESHPHTDQPAPTQNDIDRLSTRIDHCLRALPQACDRTETDFLNIGRQLQDIYTESERLTQMAQEAVKRLAENPDEEAPADIIDTAYHTLGDLKEKQSDMANRAEAIASVGKQVRKLKGLTVGFGRIAKDLKMVAININIESTRNEESRESFTALSQEIRQLSNTVADLGQTLRDEIQTITEKLETMGQKVDADLNRLSQLIDDASQVIDGAAPEYQALMASSVQALERVSANGSSISRSTGQIVVNLQIHDNVSQRVAHVAEALADANKLFLDVNPDGQTPDDGIDPISSVYANLRLQGAQLATIVTDIDTVYRESAEAFGVVDDTVRDITATILNIAQGDHANALGGGKTYGSLDSFKSALEKIQNLIGESDDALDGITAIGHDATSAAASIDNHISAVKQVNFDIHLKSLNAIFKSSQLGDRGRSIGVLVQEMKALATQSNELVEKIESINTTIIDHVHQLQSGDGAAKTDDHQQTATGARRFDELVKDFFDNRDSFNAYAEEMAALGKGLAELIEAVGNRLSFIVPFTQELTSHQKDLDACSQDLSPWCNTDGTAALDEASLSQRYTMEQERIIHEAILDGDADGAKTHQAPEDVILFTDEMGADQKNNDSQQEDNFGDNVELF